jgi:hypothetical protein
MTSRFRRRQSWDSPHDRARARAAERLWEVLPAGEAEWLDRHLSECRDCRAVADSYEAQRLELRGLRDRTPVPPRDLWARTAAAIEREDARRRPSLRPDPAPRMPLLRRKRPSPVPLGAISGLLVVAVVVGVSLLGGRATQPQLPTLQPTPPQVAVTLPPFQTTGPSGTPIVVAAADVGWMRVGPNGQIEVFFSPIDQVCADTEGPDCAPIDEASPRSGAIADAPPEAVVKSPDDKSLIVVQGPTDNGAGKVIVVPVPTAPGSTPEPTATTTPTPVVTATPPVESATPGVETPTPPVESATPPVETPSAPVETPTPSLVSQSQSPLTGPLEIASGVIVVGQSAAYSPDGAWFAFSARPTDGSQGPDIYVWRVGDPVALPITADHRSVFSGWLDGQMIGSRAVVVETVPEVSPVPTDASPVPADASPTPTDGSPAPAEASPVPLLDLRPEAFLLDPATGAETPLPEAPFWRPSVDPIGHWAVYWDGTVSLADNGLEWRAGAGQLVVGAWPPVPAEPPVAEGSQPPASETPASGSPDTSPVSPAVSPDDSATASSSPSPEPTAAPQVLDTSAIRDWDARWDEAGTHLAIWIADQADPTIGRLSLYVFDPATGTLDLAEPLLSAKPALPGFSISSDRLAWATPDNQDGEGSHVEVLAWKGHDSGQVQSAPGDDQVVVIR